MKFFHVYNDWSVTGLEKNGLINRDTGFKIQNVFSVPQELQFNNYAAKGGKLHSMIKGGRFPFYIDRIAGGITYYPYEYDRELLEEYRNLLGDWFLGCQLHESGSNRMHDWKRLIERMGGKGPYDLEKLRSVSLSPYAVTPDGTYLFNYSLGSTELYSKLSYAETHQAYMDEMRDMFSYYMERTGGCVLPCDSYYQAAKLQDDVGMRTFMPEVGCQIQSMRVEVALARGVARASGKTWGTYYECWRSTRGFSCMPCFNSDPGNEWYLTQQTHPDDFTSYGENGGSSRLLQNRIYYHSLMSGADYLSEEWGLNCSYSDMKEFTLSPYGEVKKDFIRTAEGLRGIQAVTPFAIVLPKEYSCVELPGLEKPVDGTHRSVYMARPLSAAEQSYFGHIEDVLRLFFAREEPSGNEGHVLTNSRFGDLFDIVYEDAGDAALSRYEYLIDATEEGSFAARMAGSAHKILESGDLDRLGTQVRQLAEQIMPCTADGLHWLVSTDERGRMYLSLFNNEGNERDFDRGDVIDRAADRRVQIRLSRPGRLDLVKRSSQAVCAERAEDTLYCVTIPAAGFAVFALELNA